MAGRSARLEWHPHSEYAPWRAQGVVAIPLLPSFRGITDSAHPWWQKLTQEQRAIVTGLGDGERSVPIAIGRVIGEWIMETLAESMGGPHSVHELFIQRNRSECWNVAPSAARMKGRWMFKPYARIVIGVRGERPAWEYAHRLALWLRVSPYGMDDSIQAQHNVGPESLRACRRPSLCVNPFHLQWGHHVQNRWEVEERKVRSPRKSRRRP